MNFKKNNVFLSDSDLKKRKVITNDHINKVIEDKRHKFWFYYFHNIYFSKDKTLPLLFQYNKSTPDAQTISPYPDLCRNSTFKFLPIFTF